jgi:transketolase
MDTGMSDIDLARLAVNTIKMLAVDGVEKAKSGHPGLPMGAADYAFVLWSRYLKHDPADPMWPDRDRFVLSAGHGSMLLYSLLYLSGYNVTLDDLASFRQWGSRTPGHPEKWCLPGVEVTTGPLGQGFGNAVGMALGAKMLAERVNTPEYPIIDHFIYALCSDGDLMEGVASEAASLAGHLALGNIIFFYDDNHITIDGPTGITFTEDVGKRFEAYGWHVQRIDGHDHAAIASAIEAAQRETTRPSLIAARTHIAQGSPGKHDTPGAHGSPLGKDETVATKRAMGWPQEPPFFVPQQVRDLFAARKADLARQHERWAGLRESFRAREPRRAQVLSDHLGRSVPHDIAARLLEAAPRETGATRTHGGRILQNVAALVPSVVGGAADLVESTKTVEKGSPAVTPNSFIGRNIAWGVREHGMAAVANGLAYYGAFIPYGSTFLVFSDYMRPAIRLAALAELQVIHVFTHDSILLGEDGPTHQPIEQIASLRVIPNVHVVRPADAAETALAWAHALQRRHGPTLLMLTRQDVPPLDHGASPEPFGPEVFFRGGYILAEASSLPPKVVIVATGSEVAPSVEARAILESHGIPARVVSMPCVELFETQAPEYRARLLAADDPAVRVVVVEAGVPHGWARVAGRSALVIGMERFGASAPSRALAENFGFTGTKIAERIRGFLTG